MTCYFGAYCGVRSGLATCECGPSECPAKEGPSVCGSDGRTYISACHLRTHACRTQSDVVVQAFGACGDELPHVRRGSRSAGRPPRSTGYGHAHENHNSLEYIKISSQHNDASIDTSDSGKPDSPEPELTCVELPPPVGYR